MPAPELQDMELVARILSCLLNPSPETGHNESPIIAKSNPLPSRNLKGHIIGSFLMDSVSAQFGCLSLRLFSLYTRPIQSGLTCLSCQFSSLLFIGFTPTKKSFSRALIAKRHWIAGKAVQRQALCALFRKGRCSLGIEVLRILEKLPAV